MYILVLNVLVYLSSDIIIIGLFLNEVQIIP